MKLYKVLLILFISIVCVSCTSSEKQLPNTNTNESITMREVPEYKHPDDFFNKTFTKDEDGNYYFMAGLNYYKVDQKNKVTKVFNILFQNKYLVRDAKYYEGKIYLLISKVNHKVENGALGLATVDLHGNNFQYLDNLVYNEKYLPGNIVNFRIENRNIYLLDLYSEIQKVFTYSLDSRAVVDSKETTIEEERFEFYNKYFPDYPYKDIQHVRNNNFYHVIETEKKEKIFVQYDPIHKTKEEYNITDYYVSPNTTGILVHIDMVDNNWFIFSSKGVFKFDKNFENKQQLLDSSIFNQHYILHLRDGMVNLELVKK
ncbi:MAG: hypothetical protein RR500_01205 [Bacilli bacterium]